MKAVLLILLLPIAAGFACVSYQDCPEMCIGAVRDCSDNMCTYSECIVPNDVQVREGIETFEESMQGYEGIDIKKNRHGILSSLGLEGVIVMLLKGMAAFIALLIAAFLFVLAKQKGLAYIFIVIALLGAALVYFLFAGSSASGWSAARVNDFRLQGSRAAELDAGQLDYISPMLLEGAEYTVQRQGREERLIVLEMQSVQHFSTANLQLAGTASSVSGEDVLASDGRYIFDEDRFIFILAANNPDIISEVVDRYKGPATRSRLFFTDIIPPVIRIISPSEISQGNLLEFAATDNESGVDKASIEPDSMCQPYDQGYRCTARVGTKQGMLNYIIQVSDRAGNTAVERGSFLFDNSSAVIELLSPQYTNSQKVHIRLSDQYSGIVSHSLPAGSCNQSGRGVECAYTEALSQGWNTLLVEATDKAGNSDVLSARVYYDTTAPAISVDGMEITIYEPGGLASLSINGKEYSLSLCTNEEAEYTCTYDGTLHEATAIDRAENRKTYIG